MEMGAAVGPAPAWPGAALVVLMGRARCYGLRACCYGSGACVQPLTAQRRSHWARPSEAERSRAQPRQGVRSETQAMPTGPELEEAEPDGRRASRAPPNGAEATLRVQPGVGHRLQRSAGMALP